jgi:hypothetical protein
MRRTYNNHDNLRQSLKDEELLNKRVTSIIFRIECFLSALISRREKDEWTPTSKPEMTHLQRHTNRRSPESARTLSAPPDRYRS